VRASQKKNLIMETPLRIGYESIVGVFFIYGLQVMVYVMGFRRWGQGERD
jgi:hypothetical protein